MSVSIKLLTELLTPCNTALEVDAVVERLDVRLAAVDRRQDVLARLSCCAKLLLGASALPAVAPRLPTKQYPKIYMIVHTSSGNKYLIGHHKKNMLNGFVGRIARAGDELTNRRKS